MGKEKMTELLQSGKGKIPKRVYDQLQEMNTAVFTTPADALTQLREKLQAVSLSYVAPYHMVSRLHFSTIMLKSL